MMMVEIKDPRVLCQNGANVARSLDVSSYAGILLSRAILGSAVTIERFAERDDGDANKF